MTEDEIVRQVSEAIDAGNVSLVVELLRAYPNLRDYSDALTPSWLVEAARCGHIRLAEKLLEIGIDVNKADISKDENEKADLTAATTALSEAVDMGQVDVVKYLLSRGADPNLGRPLIGAITLESEELGLTLVKLLVEHATDVNRLITMFGSYAEGFTALSWAVSHGKMQIAEYLRSKGACMPKQRKMAAGSQSLSAEVVTFFEGHFGPVKPEVLIEILPTDLPISIHIVPASEGRNHITLFTTGMSEQAMIVPPDNDDYQFAELFMELPADWPLEREKLSNPHFGWPVEWLRLIAKYPHQNATWLGGPVTIFANGDPPAPLAPGLKFTSMLLLAEQKFTRQDGRTIQLYRLTPLYTEERDLEIEQGLGALMRSLDEANIGQVFNPTRPNAAKG